MARIRIIAFTCSFTPPPDSCCSLLPNIPNIHLFVLWNVVEYVIFVTVNYIHTYIRMNILTYVCIITTNSCRLPSSKSFNVIITYKIRHHTLSKKIIILGLWEIELIRDWEKCPYAYKATLQLIKGLPMNLWDFFEELFVWQGLWTNKKGEYAIFFWFWIFVNEKIYFWYFAKLIKNRKGKFYSKHNLYF